MKLHKIGLKADLPVFASLFSLNLDTLYLLTPTDL